MIVYGHVQSKTPQNIRASLHLLFILYLADISCARRNLYLYTRYMPRNRHCGYIVNTLFDNTNYRHLNHHSYDLKNRLGQMVVHWGHNTSICLVAGCCESTDDSVSGLRGFLYGGRHYLPIFRVI